MTNNIGQTGFESIRIDGREIKDLPLGQGNEAKEGVVGFLKTDKENRMDAVRAKYPPQEPSFLRGAIRECEHNIKKIKEFKANLKVKITEYRQLIRDCDFRDREMDKYSADNPDHAEAMKELRLKYPPYDVDAMHTQITQFEDGIARSDGVIEQDFNSISEVKQVLVLVEQRDRELLLVT